MDFYNYRYCLWIYGEMSFDPFHTIFLVGQLAASRGLIYDPPLKQGPMSLLDMLNG